MDKDTIYRQQAIDALIEYGSGNSIYMSVGELKRRIEALPSAQPDGTDINVGSMISRQAAYDALMAEPLKWDDSSVWESARCHQWMMDMDVIKALPPAPERKTGKWIAAKYPFSKCSICECYFDTANNIGNFCPNCGSYNGGERDE